MQIWKYFENWAKDETILEVEVVERQGITEVFAQIGEQEHYCPHFDEVTTAETRVLAVIYETCLSIDPTKWVGLTLEQAWLRTAWARTQEMQQTWEAGV